MISLQNVRFGYDGKALFQNLSCAFPDRALTCVIGPNGSGKSTCLKLCARLIRPQSGEILVDGLPAHGYDACAFARALAFLPQSRPLPSITVSSLVSHGRFAYLGLSHKLRPEDEAAVEGALRATGMLEHAGRELRALSGGQRQKAYLAMLIAQGAQNLLLDEPMTYLDVRCQLELLELLATLRDEGRCVVMILHDLALAREAGDRALLLHNGVPIYDGAAEGLFSSGRVEEAFGVRPLPGAGVRFERV